MKTFACYIRKYTQSFFNFILKNVSSLFPTSKEIQLMNFNNVYMLNNKMNVSDPYVKLLSIFFFNKIINEQNR